MTVDDFLFLLVTSTAVTIVLTHALKRLLNKADTPYRANIVTLDSAMISCTGISILFRIPKGLGYSPILVNRLVILILCTWFLSMFVYDKLRQTVKQYRAYKRLMEK